MLDMEERHEVMVEDWNRLQAQINDKQHEMFEFREKVRKYRELDQRLEPFLAALLQCLDGRGIMDPKEQTREGRRI